MAWCDEHWLNKCLTTAYKYAKKNKTLDVIFHNNRLVVNGTSYNADNLFELPPSFSPLNIFTPRTSNKVAFYTSLSPLSNHFPSPIEIDGIKYNCMEQYFMHQKALLFADKEAERTILHTTDPVKQKSLGRRVKNFVKRRWDQHVPHVLWTGLLAKFQQNSGCSNFLKGTANCRIYEASDSIYGVGLNVFDPKIWDERFHRGKNLMGIYLQRVRKHLFENTPKNLCGWVESSVTPSKMDSVKTIEIGSRKKGNINEFKGTSYIHFYDAAKSKSFTFSSAEFKELMAKKDEIEQCFIFLNRRREKRNEENESYPSTKGGGKKRYTEPDEYYTPYGPPKQKQLRPTQLPDYGEVPSSSPGDGPSDLADYC